MTVASAIAALNPNLWYKLDEPSGTTASNSGSLANNGTYSGTYQQGVPGPEIGTLATRLFATGQVVSIAMDLTAYADVTLMFIAANEASGTNSTPYPIVSIGDVSNRFSRGPVIWDNHNVTGEPNYLARWNVATQISGQTAVPRKLWHQVAVTFATGTNGEKLYIDGVLSQQATPSTTVACLNTDPLLIKCDEPIVIAHVCFWNRVLTQVELQTISTQISNWNYNVPINTPQAGGGGGGGLTPEQATQLSEIDTKTDDIPGLVDASTYISDTVNEINGKVDALTDLTTVMQGTVDNTNSQVATIAEIILPALQAKVDEIWQNTKRELQTLAGIGISTPTGSLLAHPDDNFLRRSSDYFDISGDGFLEGFGIGHMTGIYGLMWDVETEPPEYGLRVGFIPEYIGRLVQFSAWYYNADEEIIYVAEIQDFRYKAFLWKWTQPFPVQIRYSVTPGFVLRCYWWVFQT